MSLQIGEIRSHHKATCKQSTYQYILGESHPMKLSSNVYPVEISLFFKEAGLIHEKKMKVKLTFQSWSAITFTPSTSTVQSVLLKIEQVVLSLKLKSVWVSPGILEPNKAVLSRNSSNYLIMFAFLLKDKNPPILVTSENQTAV